jgi:hypothetical protein
MNGGFVSGTANEGEFEDEMSSAVSIDSLAMAGVDLYSEVGGMVSDTEIEGKL